MKSFLSRLLPYLFSLALLASCNAGQPEASYPKAPDDVRRDRNGTLTGEGGLFKLGGKQENSSNGPSIGVNGYLWRASLDTVSFMPLTSADPFGGVIITDWYADPKTPKERFKLNIVILGGDLRADGVRVTVFKQALDHAGNWHDAAVNPTVGRELEDKILTGARQLRVNRKAG